MVVVSRYSADGDEANILKNKLGIKESKLIQDIETLLLTDSYDHFEGLLKNNKLHLELNLLFNLHSYFLSTLYTWAGKIRTVNISKGTTFFIPANNIESALRQFEPDFEKNKPRVGDSKAQIAKKLAFLHCELNVIHPFREGNGRTLRLFLDLLTIDAGYQALDFKTISNKKYIEACRKGLLQDYEAMEKIYRKLLRKAGK